jgi:ferredoxin-type protein NapH
MLPGWTIARRALQLGLLAAFAGAPWAEGQRWVQGTLASSLWFGQWVLSDPLVMLQALVAGAAPGAAGWWGAGLVVLPVLLLGGRLFCGWVCPVNLLTDAVDALRRAIGWRGGLWPRPHRHLRLLLLAAVLVASAASGQVVWEWVNPITAVSRALAFGLWAGAAITLGLVLGVDLLLVRRGWCGTLCPVGALHALLGRWGRLRVAAPHAAACTRCGDCFEACPEPQVIVPVLAADRRTLHIADGDCLRCGRCLEVCDEGVFEMRLLRSGPAALAR